MYVCMYVCMYKLIGKKISDSEYAKITQTREA